jgi:predicted nucleic acid-binding protein
MTEIFVDSGAWLALADRRDQWHGRATAVYPQILQQWTRLVTTNLIIAESYTLIRRRLGHTPAIQFLSSLRQTTRLLKIYADENLDAQAEAILRQYSDQDFSFVDAVSFAAMQAHQLSETFAFDNHFRVMGFLLVPN